MPGRATLDTTLQVFIDVRQSLLQPLDMILDIRLDILLRPGESVTFRNKHLHRLTAEREQTSHLTGLLVRQ